MTWGWKGARKLTRNQQNLGFFGYLLLFILTFFGYARCGYLVGAFGLVMMIIYVLALIWIGNYAKRSADRHKANCILIRTEGKREKRLEIETDLRQAYDPPCNRQ